MIKNECEMRKFYKPLQINALCGILVFFGVAFTSKTYAVEESWFTEKIRFSVDVKYQHIHEDNADLGTRFEDSSTRFSADIRPKIFFQPTETITSYAEGRVVFTEGSSSLDDPGLSPESFAELRQFWVKFDDLFHLRSLALQVGRQRIREDRNIWWNRDFDAIRVRYDSTLFRGFIGIGQNLAEYRTGSGDFSEEDIDRLRIFGEGQWQLRPNQAISVRFLYENDHSETGTIGQLVDADDRDDEDLDLFWIGGRFIGDLKPNIQHVKNIYYRLELIAAFGDETLLTTSRGPSDDFRVIATVRNRDVWAWAVDAAINVALDIPLNPVLTFGYTFASGDDDPMDGTDNTFRQTGLHGSSSRIHEDFSAGTMRNYGEVLRPELSNIHIITAAVNIPVLTYSEFNLIYHYYHLDNESAGLRDTGISARLNGVDKGLGHGLDLVSIIHIGTELNLSQPLLRRMFIKISLGGFIAGEAYGVGEGEFSFRTVTELKFRF